MGTCKINFRLVLISNCDFSNLDRHVLYKKFLHIILTQVANSSSRSTSFLWSRKWQLKTTLNFVLIESPQQVVTKAVFHLISKTSFFTSSCIGSIQQNRYISWWMKHFLVIHYWWVNFFRCQSCKVSVPVWNSQFSLLYVPLLSVLRIWWHVAFIGKTNGSEATPQQPLQGIVSFK